MYPKMRRQDRSIGRDNAMSILINGEYGVLSTVDKENQPYGVPLHYVVIEDDIFFHCAHEGHKIDNLLYNPEVSFCVVGEEKIIPEKFTTTYESVIVSGTASVAYGAQKKEGLMKLLRKYSPDHTESGEAYIVRLLEKTTVIKISINHLTGKANAN